LFCGRVVAPPSLPTRLGVVCRQSPVFGSSELILFYPPLGSSARGIGCHWLSHLCEFSAGLPACLFFSACAGFGLGRRRQARSDSLEFSFSCVGSLSRSIRASGIRLRLSFLSPPAWSRSVVTAGALCPVRVQGFISSVWLTGSCFVSRRSQSLFFCSRSRFCVKDLPCSSGLSSA
jgi:hypothetical protein